MIHFVSKVPAPLDCDNYTVAIAKDDNGNWVITAFDNTRKQSEKTDSSDTTRLHQSNTKGENGELVSPDESSAGKDTTKSLTERIKSGEIVNNAAENTYDELLKEFDGEEADVKTFIKNQKNKIKSALNKEKNVRSADINKIKQARQRRNRLETEIKYWETVEQVPIKRKQEADYNERKREEEERNRKKEEQRKESQKKIITASGIEGIRQRYEKTTKKEGNKGTKVLPNGEKVRGRYVLIEAEGVTPSHDISRNFAQSEGFPTREDGSTLNDRDYERDTEAQGQVLQRSRQYDGRAVGDMPIIDSNGIVLSGNDRTMSGQLAAQQNTDNDYLESLRENAQMYGFTEEDVAGMEHPRLVFVLDDNMDYTTETFAKFNQNEKKSQNNIEKAVKVGKTIKPETVTRIAEIIDGYDSIAECLSDKEGVNNIITLLVNDGQIQRNDVEQYLNNGIFNEAGKEYIQTLILGATLSEKSVRMLNAMPFMKRSIVTALKQILQNAKLGEDYSLKTEIDEAIKTVYEAHKMGIKQGESLKSYLTQLGLFGENNIKTRTVEILSELLNSEKVKELKKVLISYNENAQDSASGMLDMFSGGIKSKEEILEEIIKQIEDNEQRTRPKQSITVSDGNKRKPDSRTTDGGQSTDDGRRSEEASQRTGSADAERNDEEIKPIGKGVFGNIYDQFRGKVKEAVDFLLKHKEGDLLGVFHREEIGDIDLVWGDTKAGLRHIFEKHIIKQNDFNNIDEMIDAMDDVISKGKIRKEDNQYVIEKDNNRVVIAETENKNFVVTAYDFIRSVQEKKRNNATESVFGQQTTKSGSSPMYDDNVSVGKDNIKSHFGKKNKLKINKKDENKIGVALYIINKEAKRYRDLKKEFYEDGLTISVFEGLKDAGALPDSAAIDEWSRGVYGVKDSDDIIFTSEEEMDESLDVLKEHTSPEDWEDFKEEIDKLKDDLYDLNEILGSHREIFSKFSHKISELYNLKEQIIENLDDTYIIERHKFPAGDVRDLYKIGDFTFHGKDIQDELSDDEYDKIEEIEEISSENKLGDKNIPIQEAEKILNDFISKNITEPEGKRKGMLGAVLDALRKAIGKDNVITDNRQAQRVIDEVNGRVRPEMTEDVFYSNAERSVESISQDKATPEQWLKMIEKQGGLKAGEDKWLGLSDWLKDSKEKTLTKQDVLDFIRSNKIQIEEVEYGDVFFSPNSKINFENDIARARENGESYESVIEAWDEKYDTLLRYAYRNGLFTVDENGKVITNTPILQPINETRRYYTTAFLKNKKEIAIVVPNIESWNERDEIHFGDAGNGRAVAWIRFGETTDKDGDRVLVIDEIQSKRHQEGREKGYASGLTAEEKARLQELKRSNNMRQVISEVADFLHEKGFLNSDSEKEEYFQEDAYLIYNGKYGEFASKYGKEAADMLQSFEDGARERQKEIDELEKKLVGVPDAPFEKNWHEVAMKRMLRYAAENGYDKVAWTTGEQQAERYNIGNVVESIIYYDYPARKDKEGRNTKKIVIRSHNNEPMSMRVNNEGLIIDAGSELRGKNLMEVLGKELAAKILNGDGSDITLWDESMDNPAKEINGNGLRIGGEGMKGFYDQILPRFMDKYGKKWGVKTQDVELPEVEEAGRIMHSVDVTDEMRRSVMEGQPLFQRVSSEEVNKRFNEELQQQIDGTLPKDHTYQLGQPSPILISTKIPKLSIELKASRLSEKSKQKNHPFELENVKDLVKALQEPIAIFEYGDKEKAQNIIIEINREGKNFLVGLSLNPKDLQINDIRGIFPKDNAEWLNWITQGKSLYLDKERIQTLINQQRINLAEVEYLDLDSVAKLVKEFENPAIIEQKNAEKIKEHRLVGGNSGYVGYSMSKRAEQAREEGRYPKTDFKKVYNISDKTLKALVSAGIIDDNEWHHTSKYGNKTTFYGWSEEKFATIYRLFKKEIDAIVKENQPQPNPYKYTEWNEFSEEFQALPYNVKKDKGSKELQDFLKTHPEDKAKYEENERYNQWQAQAPSQIETRRIVSEKLNKFFDEKDVKFFKTEGGEAYGFTVGGKVYVDERIADASTPIHEYTHLWAEALRKVNPKEWQNIVSLMKKQTHLWDKVKNDYPELKTDDEIADEVLAHYSGERGKKLLDEEYNKIRGNNKLNIFDKAKMLQAINNVREALRKFWKGVADFLGIHFTSAEEVADKVLSDLLEGVNPNEISEIVERAKADGTYMKAPNGKKSNLNEKQWVQVRTKAFKKWFGDWELAKLIKQARNAWNNKESKDKYIFSPSKKLKDRFKELLGQEINAVIITDDAIRHIKKHHSENEELRGQVNLTPEDIATIPFVMNNWDVMELDPENNDKMGNRAILIKKRINGISAVGTIEKGKEKEFIVTSWKYIKSDVLDVSKETPEPNVRNDSDIAKIQKEIEIIKKSEENSSKIVDENGEPMVVYHSGNSGITAFSRDFDKTGIGRQFWGKGFYFGTIKSKYEWARIYKEKKGKDATEYAVFLNLRNPKKGVLGDKDYSDFDGAILPPVNAVGGKTEPIYIAKKPNQIKSATDNVGTFDGENADIRFHKSTERVVEEATDEALEEVKDNMHKRVYKRILSETAKDKLYSFADDYHALRVMEDKVIEEMRKRDPKFRLHHSVYEQQIAAKAATQGQIFLFSQQTFKPLLDKVEEIKYQ